MFFWGVSPFLFYTIHSGIRKQSYSVTKSALNKNPDKKFQDPIYVFIKRNEKEWQKHLNTNNKFHSIKPILEELEVGFKKGKERSHSFILKGKDQPISTICQATLTVKHIFTECTHLAPVKHKYYKENNIKKLFENVEINKIISDLKSLNIYKK